MKLSGCACCRSAAWQARGCRLALVVLLASSSVAQAPKSTLPEGPSLSEALPASVADAERAVEAGRFGAAEAILRVYLQRDGASAQGRYLLAYALLRQGKAKEALDEYTRAASLRRPSADDLRNVGQAYVLLGDYPDADKWLNASLKMEPNLADSWYNLGRLRYIQNRFGEAADCFTKVLALSPRSVKAENNLGLAYEGLNRTQDAEGAYRQALAWEDAGPPGAVSEQPLLNLATLLLHGPNPGQAQPLLLRAVLLAPRDAHIHEQLGQLAMRESKFAEAAKEFKTACGLDPGRSSLHFLLGQALKRLGQEKDASAELAEAARLARISSETKPN